MLPIKLQPIVLSCPFLMIQVCYPVINDKKQSIATWSVCGEHFTDPDIQHTVIGLIMDDHSTTAVFYTLIVCLQPENCMQP